MPTKKKCLPVIKKISSHHLPLPLKNTCNKVFIALQDRENITFRIYAFGKILT